MNKIYVSPQAEALSFNALCVFAASDNIEAFMDPEDFEDSEDPNNP